MKKLLLACFLLSFAMPALALTGTVVGTSVNLAYQEPNVNADNTPLDDLAKTTVYYQPAGWPAVVGVVVPATRPQGDGNINTSITLPMVEGHRTVYTIWATASDLTGNESVPSNSITVTVDTLAPAAPR